MATDARDAVGSLASVMSDLGRFAILGESLGAYLAVALLAELPQWDHACVLLFAVSNLPLATREKFLATPVPELKDEEIIEVARHFGGEAAVPDDPELIPYAVRTLRSDFLLSESVIATYRTRRITSDIQVIAGRGDRTLNGDLSAWSLSTTGRVDVDYLNGGHLLLTEKPVDVAAIVAARLSSARRSAPVRYRCGG